MSANGTEPLEVQILAKEGEDVVPLTPVEIQAGAGTSEQTAEEDALWTPGDCLPPPQNLVQLQGLTDISSIRNTCLGALVRNSVGLGWDVEPWEQTQADVTGEEKAKARRELDAAARRDTRLDEPGFSTLMEAVKRDQKEIGNGYIEVSRNKRTGQVDGLYYLPGIKVRRKRDRTGYVMGQNAASIEGDPVRTEYLNFGSKVEYDSKGRPKSKLAPGAGRWKQNEVIAFREYTPLSRDYGLPRDYNMGAQYAAARFVGEWMASFFQGSGSVAKLVFVQGQERRDTNSQRVRFTVPQTTISRIGQAVKADASPGSRVVVVPVPPGTQIQDVDLGQMSERDLTFETFNKMHRRHVGSALGPLSPIFVGDVEDAGRYTAEVQRAITLEQVFDPDQRSTEDRIWNTLLLDMGYEALKLKFKRLAVEGDAVKRESANSMAEVGAVTIEEFRNAHGKGALDEKVHGEGANEKLIDVGRPDGAEDRTLDSEDQRGLRPGIGARVAKHEHGVAHVDEIASELAGELEEYGPVAERRGS